MTAKNVKVEDFRPNNIKPSHKKKPTPVKKPRTLGSPSQRARQTKTGLTKKPSARLMARRAKDTVPGYYPNPIDDATVRKIRQLISKAIIDVRLKASKVPLQARLSYAQGVCDSAYFAGAITMEEYETFGDILQRAANGKLL